MLNVRLGAEDGRLVEALITSLLSALVDVMPWASGRKMRLKGSVMQVTI